MTSPFPPYGVMFPTDYGIRPAGDAPDASPCYPGRLRATPKLIGINREEPE
jgi:hypothetical protein